MRPAEGGQADAVAGARGGEGPGSGSALGTP